MKLARVTTVEAVRYPVLRVVFDDGFAGEIDLSDSIAEGEIFAPLKDPDYFRQVAIAQGGRSFGWNLDEVGEEIDLCADSARIDIETKMVSEMAERHRNRRTAAE